MTCVVKLSCKIFGREEDQTRYLEGANYGYSNFGAPKGIGAE